MRICQLPDAWEKTRKQLEKICEQIDGNLAVAVRRGILENEGGTLRFISSPHEGQEYMRAKYNLGCQLGF